MARADRDKDPGGSHTDTFLAKPSASTAAFSPAGRVDIIAEHFGFKGCVDTAVYVTNNGHVYIFLVVCISVLLGSPSFVIVGFGYLCSPSFVVDSLIADEPDTDRSTAADPSAQRHARDPGGRRRDAFLEVWCWLWAIAGRGGAP